MKRSPGHKAAKEDYIRALMQRGRFREKQGLLKEALQDYQSVMNLSPGHEEAEEAYLRLRLEGIAGE